MIFSIRKKTVTYLVAALSVIALGLGCWAIMLREQIDIAEAKIGGFEEAARIRRQSD